MTEEYYKEASPEEKKQKLFFRQKYLLDEFLKRGAISEAQYKKSLGDLALKMNMTELILNLA